MSTYSLYGSEYPDRASFGADEWPALGSTSHVSAGGADQGQVAQTWWHLTKPSERNVHLEFRNDEVSSDRASRASI